MDSQPGDYIGGGIDQTFTDADGVFTPSRNFDNGVSIYFNGGPHWWYLDFAAPMDAPLAPGVYEGATRWPFQSPASPGLSVSGEGRGCNTLTGRLEVLEVEYGAGGEVLRFAATFEQHCEGAAPALLGSILFNSTLPPPPPPPSTCISKVATIPDLLASVNALPTSPTTVTSLSQPLLDAEDALSNSQPRRARTLMALFVTRAVRASNLGPANPDSIAITAGNTLACGAANVLTNITIP
jgi:hypothetical protein